MKTQYTKLLFILIVLFLENTSQAQSIPTGSAILEDLARRSQMLNTFDSSQSFQIKPLRFNHSQPALIRYDNDTIKVIKDLYKNKFLKVSTLPLEIRTEYNSHHPYNWNNGAMVPGRGFQTIVRGGFFASLSGYLTVELKPEILYSQNLEYEGFPDTLNDNLWQKRYIYWNSQDAPEHFGTESIKKILPGQSSIRLNYKNLSLGISTENLWWGPGRRNALLMSNNANGFLHLTFNTLKPLQTPIGSFEWQLIVAKLNPSGFAPPKPKRHSVNQYFNTNKPNDWRYLNALTVSYQPKWVKGLSMGFARSIQQYSKSLEISNNYLPVFINIFRESDGDRDETLFDQLISIFARYYSSKAQGEIYFEYGRNDASLNLRDFILTPEQSRAYLLGLTKYFSLHKKNQYIEVNIEMTELQQTVNYLVRNAGSWYVHHPITHGYTHEGEVLGAGIGSGSDLQMFQVNWVHGMKKIGFQFERLEHNKDLYYQLFEHNLDWRRYWVDLTFTLNGSWDFNKKILLESNLSFTNSLNYQWELHSFTNDGLPYWRSGRDVFNVFLGLNVSYMF